MITLVSMQKSLPPNISAGSKVSWENAAYYIVENAKPNDSFDEEMDLELEMNG